MISIAVADRHPMVVDGIASLVRSDGNYAWLGSAVTWPSLIHLVALQAHGGPAVAVIEPAIGPSRELGEGIQGLIELGVRVVLNTADQRPVPIRRAVAAGAIGVVLKSDPREAMAAAIHSAAAGAFFTSSEWAQRLVFDQGLMPRLAPREEEVLHLLATGMPRKVVGRHMNPPVAMTTVVTYINRICEKYREAGRSISCPTDALFAAARDGYLDLGGDYPEGSVAAVAS
ncbi:helix-turn-helix domain-containing protein [Nostocoides australiense]